MKNKKNFVFSALCIFLIILIITNPQKYSSSCLNGFLIFGKNVLPTLFPFFFLTKLLGETNAAQSLSKKLEKLTQKLFGTSGASSYIFLMSILSGYPVGAKLTADFYEKKLIDKNEAFKICTFTSTSGPLFVIGTVGMSMLFSYKCAVIIFFSHIIGAILNGMLFKSYKKKESTAYSLSSKMPSNASLSDLMYNSIISILLVGGFIAFFTVVIDAILSFKFFSAPFPKILISGLVEVTRGCLELSTSSLSLAMKSTISCAFITFGGFSIHAQALTFLSKCEISYSKFVFQKLTHTFFATTLCLILSLIIL